MTGPAGPAVRVLSLGAGVQSTALALLAVEARRLGGDLTVDVAIFADTGAESTVTYDHVDRLQARLEGVGIPLYRVSVGSLRDDLLNPEARYAAIPYFVRNPDGSEGLGRRQCTNEYKIVPIKRKVRELLGHPYPARVPAELFAEQWIGFSTDEVHRVRSRLDVRYMRPRYPLLELGMSRSDCERWLARRGWAGVSKSSCVFCPFHGNAYWRRQRRERPEEWAQACAVDAAIRKGGSRGSPLDGEAFLHRSRVPLAEAPIGHVTSAEWSGLQVDLLDVLADGEEEEPDGCSPYGCRSGEAA